MGYKKKSSFGRIIKILILTFLSVFLLRLLFFNAYKIPSSSMRDTLMEGDMIAVNSAAYKISIPSRLPFTNISIPETEIIKTGSPEKSDVVILELPYNPFDESEEEKISFVKRIIGGPGDTISIHHGKVYINSQIIEPPESAKLPDSSIAANQTDEKNLFPYGKNQNRHNLGPVYIPKKNDTISINPNNISEYQYLINRDLQIKAVSVEGTVVMVDKKPLRNYVFKNDFYFVLGDNRQNSIDSRYWGLIPESAIKGEALFVYFSKIPGKRFFEAVRFDRLFTWID